jgi:hypothetical protein
MISFRSTDRINTKKPRLAWRKWNSSAPVPDWQRYKMGRVGVRKRLMTDSKIQSGKTLLENGVPAS